MPELKTNRQNGEKVGFNSKLATETSDKTEKQDTEHDETESRGVLIAFCLVTGIGFIFSLGMRYYMSSQITVIERAFGLNSAKSGILLSATDIGYVVTVLFASHFLSRLRIPRVLAVCVMLDGIAGFLISLPHFIADEKMSTDGVTLPNSTIRDNNTSSRMLCTDRAAALADQENECRAKSDQSMEINDRNSWVLVFLALLLVVQGIVKSSRSPLTTTYIDNNANRSGTGFYLGIFSTCALFGPTIATLLGGVFSKLPVDLKETDLTPEDPRWVGAWWLGFVILGSGAIITSVPTFFFPAGRKPPEQMTKPQEKMTINNSDKIEESNDESCCSYFKDLPRSIGRVLCCPVYVLTVVGGLTMMVAMMSISAFGPKYMENQFQIPTWKANIIVGAEQLVGAALGTFVGGVVTQRLKLGRMGCIKVLLFAAFTVMLLQCLNFWFGCDIPITGLDSDLSYVGNMTCDCSGVSYLPVCADGQTYFSPCHAGCQVQTEKQGFGQCTGSSSGDVTSGLCSTGCVYLIPFIGVDGINIFVGTIAVVPSTLLILRSVKERDRAMSYGLMIFSMSLLVDIPAPILYGKLYDSLCIVWNYSCGKRTNCAVYDSKAMRITLNAINIGLQVASLILTSSAMYFIKKEDQNLENREDDEKEIVVKPTLDVKGSGEKVKDKHTNGLKPVEKSLESRTTTKTEKHI